MSNRTVPKKVKMGYGLFINRTGEKGNAAWERVGFLFNSANDANMWREANHPSVSKWRIQTIRISARGYTDKDAMSDHGTLVEKGTS